MQQNNVLLVGIGRSKTWRSPNRWCSGAWHTRSPPLPSIVSNLGAAKLTHQIYPFCQRQHTDKARMLSTITPFTMSSPGCLCYRPVSPHHRRLGIQQKINPPLYQLKNIIPSLAIIDKIVSCVKEQYSVAVVNPHNFVSMEGSSTWRMSLITWVSCPYFLEPFQGLFC